MSLLNIIPRIRIHVWGGLGSQLFGIALKNELKMTLPWRKSILVCHSSGVTKRLPEIDKFSVETLPINDFESDLRKSNLIRSWTTRSIRYLLLKLGIVADSNCQHEYRSIRPWVLSIRGHYTKLKFSQSTIKLLYENFNAIDNKQNKSEDNTLNVHYRLGDLLSLNEKNPVEIDILIFKIKSVIQEKNIKTILVYSDSIDYAVEHLSRRLPQAKVLGKKVDSHQTISDCIRAENFIGTNSKISLWIGIMRNNNVLNKVSYLPNSMKDLLEAQLGQDHIVDYY